MRHYLLVEDDRPLAYQLAEILCASGSEVDVAHDAERALALARRLRFDVVVTDTRLPAMSGAELLHEVRRFDPGVPAIVITAQESDPHLQAALREGLLAALQKPVPADELVELIEAARRDGVLLVVEDEPSLRENLCEVLRARGFAAVTAASIGEVERLPPVEPFCALVDLCVPGGPAGESARLLARRWPRLPILGVTARPDAWQFRCAGVFSKPFDTAVLLDAVECQYQARRRAIA